MHFIHRTNYWGNCINASNQDEEVDFDAIWVQATWNANGCCRGFGDRKVFVEDADFQREYHGWWSLFLVGESYGYSYHPSHYFRKFVAIPQGEYGYGKRGCSKRGWEYEGEFHSDYATSELSDLLDGYLDNDVDVNHVHVGIMMANLYT